MSFFIKTEKFTKYTLSLIPSKRKEYINEHKLWVKSIKKTGLRIFSGYLIDKNGLPGGGGILILESINFQNAETIIKTDPMIKNKLVEWELHQYIPLSKNLLDIFNEDKFS